MRGIRSSPCIELRPSPLHLIWGPSLIFILFHNYFPSFLPTLAWLVVLLRLFLNIYNTRCGSWSHLILAMPTDCITTYRSFIPYISALPPSLSYTFYIPSPIVFFLFPFSNRSFLPVHQLCRLLSLDMCIHFPRGLDWTGLDWTLALIRNVTASCYELSRLLKLLPICSLPLFFVFFSCIYILSIHMYVAPLFRCFLVPGVVVER